MRIIVELSLAVILAVIVGAGGGYMARKQQAEGKIGSAEEEAKRIVADAESKGEAKKKEALLEAREEIQRQRQELDRDTKERRGEISRQERRLSQKEENLDRKLEALEKKEETLIQRDEELIKERETIACTKSKRRSWSASRI